MSRFADNREYRSSKRTCHGGLTLVELLVVVVILVILVAVVLPLAQPTPGQRIVREASRQVNSFLAGAQARAVAEGREYGVMFIPTSGGTSCIDLSLAKLPPLYAGDQIGAIATYVHDDILNIHTVTLGQAARVVASINNDPPDLQFVEEGDRIRLGYRGPWYVVTAVALGGTGDPELQLNVPVGAHPSSGPYQIQRQPRASASGILTLPVGAYIDLNVSGLGDQDATPLSRTIMFSPDGRLRARLPANASQSVYLLVGAEKPVTGTGVVTVWINQMRNLLNGAYSVWLTVNASTGRIATIQNAARVEVEPSTGDALIGEVPYNLNSLAEREAARIAAIVASRQSATRGPSMGGR